MEYLLHSILWCGQLVFNLLPPSHLSETGMSQLCTIDNILTCFPMCSVFSEDGHFLVLLFPSSPTHPICLQAKVNLFACVINFNQCSGRARWLL